MPSFNQAINQTRNNHSHKANSGLKAYTKNPAETANDYQYMK